MNPETMAQSGQLDIDEVKLSAYGNLGVAASQADPVRHEALAALIYTISRPDSMQVPYSAAEPSVRGQCRQAACAFMGLLTLDEFSNQMLQGQQAYEDAAHRLNNLGAKVTIVKNPT